MKHFDLFSGYGGFSLALERVYEILHSESSGENEQKINTSVNLSNTPSTDSREFTTIGFSEIDKYANSVLKYRWPNIKNYGDIKKIDWNNVPDFDLLTGGSPCQDLSIAGKRAGLSGNRSGLFFEYMRAVKEKKPKYFIWENVKGALSSNNGWDFATVIREMAETGYSLWWQVLNAKDFGVPQNRERIFVVGFRDKSPREVFFERGVSRENTVEDNTGQIYEQTKKLSDAFRIRSTNGVSATLKGLGGGMGAKTGLYAITRGRSTEPWKVGTVAPSRRIGDKDDIRVCMSVLTPDRLEKRQNGRRFKEDGEPSFTLTSQDRHGIYDGCKIRRLTPTECERLMGLPDDWLKYGINEKGEKIEISDSQKYKMAGNGVVVNVVEEIMKRLLC